MSIPEKYDNNVEYHRTHPELLTHEDKENLDHVGASKKPTLSNRSVLGKDGNMENIPGVPRQDNLAGKSKNNVSWSNMVRRNL